MKILVVDDSKVMRMLVRRALRQAGYGSHDVVEAGDGKEALDVFSSEKPSLVLSDWNMPVMNGLELLGSLRAEGFGVPFVFVTTECTDEMRQQANDAGANSFIIKPFDGEDVRYALDTVLGEVA